MRSSVSQSARYRGCDITLYIRGNQRITRKGGSIRSADYGIDSIGAGSISSTLLRERAPKTEAKEHTITPAHFHF